MTTPVQFTFVTPEGVPISLAPFYVQLLRSDFKTETGTVMPREVEGITDLNGQCTLDLWHLTTPYVVSMDDPRTETGLSYRFIVPEAAPGVVYRLQDIVIYQPSPDKVWDDEALLEIQQAKAEVLAAAQSVGGMVEQALVTNIQQTTSLMRMSTNLIRMNTRIAEQYIANQ